MPMVPNKRDQGKKDQADDQPDAAANVVPRNSRQHGGMFLGSIIFFLLLNGCILFGNQPKQKK
jgi:hypothetical protein